MIKRIILFILLNIIPAIFFRLQAAHVIGNELTYKHISGSSYKIILKVFVLCSDSSYRNSQRIKISSPDSSVTCNIHLSLKSIASYRAVCDSMTAGGLCRRINGRVLTYNTYVYDSIINLSGAPFSPTICNYRFQYISEDFRYNSSSPSEKFYSYSDLARCYGNNNSAAYTVDPIVFYNYAAQHYENWGMADSSDIKDSVAYCLVPYLKDSTGTAGTVSYPSGYTYRRPIKNHPTGQPFLFDSIQTGNLMFLPYQVSDSHFLVIEATDYRKVAGNWVKLGVARRDIQYFVSSGVVANNIPSMQGIQNHSVCGGSQLCFNITTNDPQYLPSGKLDTTRLYWTQTIPKASIWIIDTTSRLKQARFCWIPDSSYEGLSKSFVMSAADNACPENGIVNRGYSISVRKTIRDLRIGKIKRGCNRYELRAWHDSAYNKITAVQWQINGQNYNGDGLIYQFPDSGYNVIKVTVNSAQNCASIYYDTVYIDSSLIRVDLGPDTSLCYQQHALTLKASVSNSLGSVSYQWNNGIADTINTSQVMLINKDTSFRRYVTVVDSRNCPVSDSVNIKTGNRPNAQIFHNGSSELCDGESVLLYTGLNLRYKYKWMLNDSLIGTGYTQHRDADGRVQVIITDTLSKCSSSADTLILVHPRVSPQFSLDRSAACLKGNLFQATDTTSDTVVYQRFWSWSDGATDTASHASHSFSIDGSYNIKLRVITDKGCADSISATLVVYPQPVARIGGDSLQQCRNSNLFKLVDSTSFTSYTRIWRYGNDSSQVKNLSVIFSYSNDSIPVDLFVTSANSCRDTDRVYLAVYENPQARIQMFDTVQCLDSNLFTFTDSSAAGRGSITFSGWYLHGDTVRGSQVQKSFLSTGTKQVSLFVENSKGCRDTATRFVTLNPNPVKPQINRSGNSLFTGSYPEYRWYRNDSLLSDSSASVNYMISGVYRVQVFNQHGCDAGSDTVHFSPITGIDKIFALDIKLFPNPANNSFRISFPEPGNYEFELLDVTGRIVHSQSIRNEKQSDIYRGNLSDGIYILLIRNKEDVVRFRVCLESY